MSDATDGYRIPDSVLGEPGGGWDEWKQARPGAYMRVNVGAPGGPEKWNLWIKDPQGQEGMCAAHIHTITVEADDTITVHPSIAPNDTNPGGYHGWLQHGKWSAG